MRDTLDFAVIMAIIALGVLGEVATGILVGIPRALWALVRDFPAAFRE